MSASEMPPDWPLSFSTAEAAEKLGLSKNSLWRAAQAGTAPIPHYSWGRAIRWPARPLWRLLNGYPPVEQADDEPVSPIVAIRRSAR